MATILRVFYIDKTIDWMDDVRDLMVVRYIIDFKGSLFVRPLASQGFDILQNTPVYYWILTVFYLITSSLHWGILSFFVLAGVGTVFINYLWAKEIAGKKVALLLAFFSAISIVFIESSRNILQPYLNNFIYSLSIYSLVLFYKNNKFVYLINFLILLFLTLFIHLSFVTVIPVFVVSCFFLIKIKSKNKKEAVSRILWFLFCLLLLSYIYLTSSVNSFGTDFFNFIDYLNKGDEIYSYQVLTFFSYLTNFNYRLLGPLFFMIIAFYIAIVFFGESRLINKRNHIFYILVLTFFVMTFYALGRLDFPFFYFFPFYSLFFFFLSSMLVELFFIESSLAFLTLIFSVYMFSMSTYKYVTDVFWMVKTDNSRDFHQQAEYLSKEISNDLKANYYSNFVINTNRIMYEAKTYVNLIADWDVLGFYYFLEDLNQEKYLNLVDSMIVPGQKRSINNFLVNYQDEETPDVIYFSCIIRDYSLLQRTNLNYLNEAYCLNPYLKFIEACYQPENLTYELMFSEIGKKYPSPYILYKINFDKKEMNNQCLSYFDYMIFNKDLIPEAFIE